ncbi:serine/threonine protein kinase, partial [Streptomyces sp. SID13726]|nr:serine/threonine protein kinase [Streptomyces sp. SID13726]
PSRTGGGPARGTGAPPPRSGGPRSAPGTRNTTRSGSGSRPAPRSGTGRPAPRNTGTGRRPANPRLLRQRLFVFVVVTLLVALGIAAAQGCEGPSRGLGGDSGVVRDQRHGQVHTPSDHAPRQRSAGDGTD